MLDWLAGNWWAIWLIAAAALAITEVTTLDFTLLMLAGGALAGAVVAAFFPGLILVQAIVAGLVAVALLFLVRPTLLRRVRSQPGYASSMDQLVGSSGRATTEITAASGEAKIGSDTWSARSYDGQPIPAGAEIEVYRIEGAMVLVYPRAQHPELR
ncbi:MAG: NfeD family protein [Micropruina sp.]|nr:MAG: NfeD family protein [Micropruina sp.]